MDLSVVAYRGLHVVGSAVALLLLTVTGGCGGVPSPVEFDQADHLRQCISGVSGAAASPETFKDHFAKGSTVPDADRERYRPYMFRMASAGISGDKADPKVQVVESGVKGDKVIGEVTWKAVRVGKKQWKLREAPLPAAAKAPK